MNVLIVGGGGREHALAWKVAQSPLVSKVYCAPGNPGIAQVAECVDIQPTDVPALLRFAHDKRVRLAIIGPEAPLVAGAVDAFTEAGIKAFGPSTKAAELEGSKVFAKKLMHQNSIPTASFRVFDRARDAHNCIDSTGAPLVVKADGLAGGKGAIVCRTIEQGHEAVSQIMQAKAFGAAGRRVVIEDCLAGEETSILALTDGKTILPLRASQDHKAVFDGDKGPNTGGMGAYAPAPCVSDKLMDDINERVLVRTVHAMAHLRRRYRGVLYAGLMLTAGGPQVLEYNVRFGDPETQPLMMLLKSDLVPALLATIDGDLSNIELEWHEGAAVCVAMASGGYPDKYVKGREISGLDAVAAMDDVVVFHAGTVRVDDKIVTDGGRVLGVTARGADIRTAIDLAYRAVNVIHFEGAHYRKDIGAKALK